MTSRYGPTRIGINDSKKYSKFFEERNIKFIRQFSTLEMNQISPNQILTLNLTSHIWKMGDRYYKLAHAYYNDPELWWVIARFNEKPTEAHLELGDVITIPLPIEKVLSFWGL